MNHLMMVQTLLKVTLEPLSLLTLQLALRLRGARLYECSDLS